jgi:hypothetical protein
VPAKFSLGATLPSSGWEQAGFALAPEQYQNAAVQDARARAARLADSAALFDAMGEPPGTPPGTPRHAQNTVPDRR